MAFGVFIHRADSIYKDTPAEQYQFPSQYLTRATQFIGDWIVYYEPRKVPNSHGYFAVAKVSDIVADRTSPGMFLALIEPGSYLEFANSVPFQGDEGITETGLLNEVGRISGRAQAAVRPLSAHDFARIISLGVSEPEILPRTDDAFAGFSEQQQAPFVGEEQERVRADILTSRIVRDRAFRRVVLRAYGERCAVTGLKLINGGGRAEVAAAHIRPVERNGPDMVNNGVALSGTVHWMFGRGLITFSDDLEIVVSRHVNDRDGVAGLINKTGRLMGPLAGRDRPHPAFLGWHRENIFKR
ncbi:MAG: HNH endonuclease [Devosia sp.]|nr:HNH endonuclease [Devosia sp.]